MPYNTKLAIPIVVVAIVSIIVIVSFYSYTMMSQFYSQPSIMMGEEQGQLTIDDSLKAAQDYIEYTGVPNLAVAEIMEFSNHFYIDVYEEDTGIHAFELIIEKDGDVYPEHGPNMMWNTKYGHHGGGMMGAYPESAEMLIDEDSSITYAQNYLDEYMPGAKATEPHRFYGYYTLHVEKDGNIIGMLSVDGFSGDVWYHNWHGDFVQILELEHH